MAQGKKRDNKISDADIKSMREDLYKTLCTLIEIKPDDIKKLSAKTKLELASKYFPYVLPKADMDTIKDDHLTRSLDGMAIDELESILIPKSNPKEEEIKTAKSKKAKK